jgi:hypothetical protein
MKLVILLTSCVRSTLEDAELKMSYYLRAIDSWLNKTSLPIYIVESSGYNFPEFDNTRLKVCTFDLQNEQSSSQYEAKSILYAMNHFREEFKEYTHVIKITARYFVDCEDIFLQMQDEDCDIILQSQVNHNIKWNNSELFGFRIGLEKSILEPILQKGFMEHTIYEFASTHSHIRFPPIENIYKVKRGGDGLIVNPL